MIKFLGKLIGTKRTYWTAIWVSFFAAVLIRLPILWQELPPYQFCDESIYYTETLRILENGSVAVEEFRAGALNIYPVWAIVKLVGLFSPINDLAVLEIGRLILVVLLSSASVFFISGSAKRLFNSTALGLVAGLLFLLSSSTLAFSRFWYPDHYLFFFVSAFMYFLVRVIKTPGKIVWWVTLGLGLSAAVSVKYSAAFLLLPVVIVLCWRGQFGVDSFEMRKRINALFAFTSAGLLSFALVNFSIFVNPRAFISGFMFNIKNYSGAGSEGSGFVFYAFLVLFFSYGMLGFFLLFFSLPSLWKADRMVFFVLLSAPIVTIAMLGSQGLVINRNVVPALPFLALLIAKGFEAFYHFSQKSKLRLNLFFVVMASLIGIQIVLVGAAVVRDLKPDSRVLAETWFRNQPELLGQPVGVNEFCSGKSPAEIGGLSVVSDPQMKLGLDTYVLNSYWQSPIADAYRFESAAWSVLDQKYVHFYYFSDKKLPYEFISGLFTGPKDLEVPAGYEVDRIFSSNGPDIVVLRKTHD